MSEEQQGRRVDPLTGEPRGGFLGAYQKVEDLLGQGTVAGIVFLIGFFLYLLLSDPI